MAAYAGACVVENVCHEGGGMKFSDQDLRLLRVLRAEGVLEDVSDHLLDQKRGAVMVFCSDGRRSYDIFTHQVRMQRPHRDEPKIHLVAKAGGALRIVSGSPTNAPGSTADLDMLEEIRLGCKLMDTNVVALYAHGACGMAHMSGMTLQSVFNGLIAAKERVKLEIPGCEVACFYHAAYPADESGGTERQRTYFLSRQRYLEVRSQLSQEGRITMAA